MSRIIEKCLLLVFALTVTLSGITFLTSCGESSRDPEYKSVPYEKMKSGNSLANINKEDLVSLTDTICGMSLNDGVADTLRINNSLYGFCSSGCKSKFQSMNKLP